MTILSGASLLFAACLAVPRASAAVTPGDGLAMTPPMGFNNWNSTHCRAEFDEAMVKGIADIFVSKGLKDAGYQYVNLDDCWALPQRGPDGNLVADPVRFPNGIKHVADYVHSKGLRFGIYTSAGTKTCSDIGFPGGLGHEQQDADLFASFGVDYLKYDNCNNQGVDAKKRYITMRDALRRTGRPIVYSLCEWGENKPWEWASDVGHLWRTTGDITDTYSSMLAIAKHNWTLSAHAKPGNWNDPDMLEVGNGGMTDTEYRSHFGLWAIMAAPLLIGSDLRKATPQTLEIIGNREIIAVDQDPLGVQGKPIKSGNGLHVLVKPLHNGDKAVLLFNEGEQASRISTSAAEVGLPRANGYKVRDLWQHADRHTADVISATVPAPRQRDVPREHGPALGRVPTRGRNQRRHRRGLSRSDADRPPRQRHHGHHSSHQPRPQPRDPCRRRAHRTHRVDCPRRHTVDSGRVAHGRLPEHQVDSAGPGHSEDRALFVTGQGELPVRRGRLVHTGRGGAARAAEHRLPLGLHVAARHQRLGPGGTRHQQRRHGPR
ncbi:hypothetical protein H4W33_003320 [Kibdelosporangium phytohabitans]|nr:hypothetical protein [Kibdelosporangium phytohabitans]